MAKLIIEGQEVELTDDVQFLLNKQWEDINDPTTIINDWSKTVSIPGSASNNALFGHIYRTDRVIGPGGTYVGADFDPYRKLSMRLEQGSDVLMEGYAKMTSVSLGKDGIKYDLTLYGSLGKVFQELKQITFDTSTDASGYLIHGENYVNAEISKSIVASSFASEGQTSTGLTGDITNYIGFAPNNAMMDDFDYKTYQASESMSTLLKDVLDENFQTNTGISPENAIGDGLTPRGIGEYRSYMQLPFIYFNKLWRIFQAKAEAVTGWTFNLDNEWFKETNPYWYNVVMMLSNLGERKAEASYNNIYNLYIPQIAWGQTEYESKMAIFSVDVVSEQYGMYIPTSNLWIFNLHKNIFTSTSVCKIRIAGQKITTSYSTTVDSFHWSNGQALTLYVQYQIQGTNQVQSIPFAVICNENTTLYDSGSILVYKVPETAPNSASSISEFSGQDYGYWDLTIGGIPMPTVMSAFGNVPVIYRIVAQWSHSSLKAVTGSDSSGHSGMRVPVCISFNIQDGVKQQSVIKVTENKGSYSTFTLNDLWDNTYTPFDIILRYCKMFRIGVYADSATKELRFVPIEKYLAEGSATTLDWTDKVDYSKDVTVQPIAFDTRYFNLGYADPETYIGETYNSKYGIQYGDMKVETAYRFNNDTKDLFDDLIAPLATTLQTLSWVTLYEKKKVAYTISAEPFVDCQDEEGKFVSLFGAMFFHLGRKAFEGGEMRSCCVTDDTPLQRESDKKFYTQDSVSTETTDVSYYPLLSCHIDDKYLTFGIPKESYVYGDTTPSGSKGIYQRRWSQYMNERYNVSNKVVTMYMRLKPYEYASFRHNQFVRIGGQLYFVNKITDYDMTSGESVKVELITIQDRSKYYGTN